MSTIEKNEEILKHKQKVKEAKQKLLDSTNTDTIESAAQLTGVSLNVHLKIANRLTTLERQMEVKDGRKKVRGSMSDIVTGRAVDMHQYFWDYNTIELFLLGCAIIVCIAGIMFESESYETRTNLDTYLEVLAVFVMIIIVWSLVYYCVVFFSEVFGSMGLENNRYFFLSSFSFMSFLSFS